MTSRSHGNRRTRSIRPEEAEPGDVGREAREPRPETELDRGHEILGSAPMGPDAEHVPIVDSSFSLRFHEGPIELR